MKPRTQRVITVTPTLLRNPPLSLQVCSEMFLWCERGTTEVSDIKQSAARDDGSLS